MKAAGETNPDVCLNDLALIEIPAQDVQQVHPAVMHFGGPTGPPGRWDGLVRNDPVYAALSSDYGCLYLCTDDPARAATGDFWDYLSNGWVLDTEWGIAGGSQGDSGGGLMGPGGTAAGVLSTGLQTGAFHYSNIWFDLAYMRAKVGWSPSIVTWSTFDAAGNYG